MTKMEVTKTVNAPLAEVWKSWDDFGRIARFAPNLKKSYLLEGSAETGLGAERHCDMADGKNFLRERVVEYVPEKRLKIDIYESSMPMKSGYATFDLAADGADKTTIKMTMVMVPKMGVVGDALMAVMKPRFTALLNTMLSGNAAYVERGVIANV